MRHLYDCAVGLLINILAVTVLRRFREIVNACRKNVIFVQDEPRFLNFIRVYYLCFVLITRSKLYKSYKQISGFTSPHTRTKPQYRDVGWGIENGSLVFTTNVSVRQICVSLWRPACTRGRLPPEAVPGEKFFLFPWEIEYP